MSVIITQAFAEWRDCRASFNDLLYAAYERAEAETNGALLNADGRAQGVDALSLFMGSEIRAHRYASPELLDHWERYPRVTFESFERQWLAGAA
ncbi:hypothetical protein [Microbacterium testaceum]|uniref:Uncharacterized protein n=1 Tax=Microbacterium testaceum TaxID=2033 RepID=A0A147F4Q5_MICTE|nr:hypothetical protein [Microbacterium testaceum]KTS09058.1 hypothetical protein RSA3_14255 [Microbacterium testaceum]